MLLLCCSPLLLLTEIYVCMLIVYTLRGSRYLLCYMVSEVFRSVGLLCALCNHITRVIRSFSKIEIIKQLFNSIHITICN